MNILFLTLLRVNDINERGIYNDLIRKFASEGHNVFVVNPSERRYQELTGLTVQNNIKVLKVKTLNIQKANIIEKGIGTLLIASQFLKAINRYLNGIGFDLIISSTPPITFTRVIKSAKKLFNASSYLLLKDIFPQNAVDIGLLRRNGVLHKYFRNKEKDLYITSDYIGTMSPASVRYLKLHDHYLDSKKVEVCPTSIEVANNLINTEKRNQIRSTYKIPVDKTVFIYGGNLGKPQGVDFLLEVLTSNSNQKGAFFVVAGSGTEYPRIQTWFERNNPTNALLLPALPKNEYDHLIQTCDVGMIFLDKRFTIPNYPSRLLSYLEFKMPIVAATDPNTDIGKIAQENGYGLWSISGDLESINKHITELSNNPALIKQMGKKGYQFLKDNYTVDHTYRIIMSHFTAN